MKTKEPFIPTWGYYVICGLIGILLFAFLLICGSSNKYHIKEQKVISITSKVSDNGVGNSPTNIPSKPIHTLKNYEVPLHIRKLASDRARAYINERCIKEAHDERNGIPNPTKSYAYEFKLMYLKILDEYGYKVEDIGN